MQLMYSASLTNTLSSYQATDSSRAATKAILEDLSATSDMPIDLTAEANEYELNVPEMVPDAINSNNRVPQDSHIDKKRETYEKDGNTSALLFGTIYGDWACHSMLLYCTLLCALAVL
ncbi:hypothetical protein MMC20_004362 [Loxospora ochrophaea]|nr:hypothetical protein [Loxospora ochrophaea]